MDLSDDERARLLKRLDTGRRGNPNNRPNKLTESQREQLVRRFIEGWPPVKLAEAYGIRRQTVDYHLRRAARAAVDG